MSRTRLFESCGKNEKIKYVRGGSSRSSCTCFSAVSALAAMTAYWREASCLSMASCCVTLRGIHGEFLCRQDLDLECFEQQPKTKYEMQQPAVAWHRYLDICLATQLGAITWSCVANYTIFLWKLLNAWGGTQTRLHICMCMFIYIYIYIYIYTYTYIHTYTRMHAHRRLCLCNTQLLPQLLCIMRHVAQQAAVSVRCIRNLHKAHFSWQAVIGLERHRMYPCMVVHLLCMHLPREEYVLIPLEVSSMHHHSKVCVM